MNGLRCSECWSKLMVRTLASQRTMPCAGAAGRHALYNTRQMHSSERSSSSYRSLLIPNDLRTTMIRRAERWRPPVHLQKCYAGSEQTKVSEEEQLDLSRKNPDEGAIMAVQSGLFKLLLPLPRISETSLATRAAPGDKNDAVLFLLHPRQPLSMIAALIQSEISPKRAASSAAGEGEGGGEGSGSAAIEVSFHGAQESISKAKAASQPQTPQWAHSTELGDFVQEAAQDSKFLIALHEKGQVMQITPIRVPTFQQRTKYLRNRLQQVTSEMQSLLDIKTECDDLALQGAKRTAFAGFGGLVLYWGTVYVLTFHVYSWDLMEPVTYLTGLTGIMGGYLWFLYHQKEISYRSVFEMSSRKRREQLYNDKGFDRQLWKELVDEGAELRRAIKKIAHDYATEWSMEKELDDEKAAQAIKKREQQKKKAGEGGSKQGVEEDEGSGGTGTKK